MKLFHIKKLIIFFAVIGVLILRHICNINTVYYVPDYEFESVKEEISSKHTDEVDYEYISKYTGLSPLAARELLESGETEKILLLNKMFFETPGYKKEYIAFPITAQERNFETAAPMADLKNGDILITYNTHTFDWRHGHAAIVVNADAGIILEHMAVGQTSLFSSVTKWATYPGFIILRYPDEDLAHSACEYARQYLKGVDYSIGAGIIKKDKSDMKKPDSSHCSHIVWQAYKAVGVDLDFNRGAVVTPKDIAKSDKLKVVQIFGINPKDYSQRFLSDISFQ